MRDRKREKTAATGERADALPEGIAEGARQLAERMAPLLKALADY